MSTHSVSHSASVVGSYKCRKCFFIVDSATLSFLCFRSTQCYSLLFVLCNCFSIHFVKSLAPYLAIPFSVRHLCRHLRPISLVRIFFRQNFFSIKQSPTFVQNTIGMLYTEFEDIISPERMHRYLLACANNSKKAMTLYRNNLKLSQEMFTIISCFEVALRNRIDKELKRQFGNDWLRDLILPGGRFDTDPRVTATKKIIKRAYEDLLRSNNYSHTKLLAEMEFGVWKFMFNNVQYRLINRCLLSIFPNKPTSTPTLHYDNTFVFAELDRVNAVRNRIAHHEPICFDNFNTVGTQMIKDCYDTIFRLFQWMGINADKLLYGLDHITSVCNIVTKI